MNSITFHKAALNLSLSLPLFLTKISAGFPSPADDYVEKELDLNEFCIKHPAATFFVRVEGESMCNANIHSGDILVVDRALKPFNGSIVVALLNGEFTVKRIRIKHRKTTLEAENSAYAPIEILQDTDFQVWGVVTYVIHKAE